MYCAQRPQTEAQKGERTQSLFKEKVEHVQLCPTVSHMSDIPGDQAGTGSRGLQAPNASPRGLCGACPQRTRREPAVAPAAPGRATYC